MYLFDTDHWTILQLQAGAEFERLEARVKNHNSDAFFVSIVTFHEVMNGWLSYLSKAKNAAGTVRGYERFEFLLGRFESSQVLQFGEPAAEFFSEMRSSKVRVATMDLRIASIAATNQLTVLTRNSVDFERVPNVTIEDWVR